jgi:hypothetical protein
MGSKIIKPIIGISTVVISEILERCVERKKERKKERNKERKKERWVNIAIHSLEFTSRD